MISQRHYRKAKPAQSFKTMRSDTSLHFSFHESEKIMQHLDETEMSISELLQVAVREYMRNHHL